MTDQPRTQRSRNSYRQVPYVTVGQDVARTDDHGIKASMPKHLLHAAVTEPDGSLGRERSLVQSKPKSSAYIEKQHGTLQ
jgi:hypothetical protein